MRLHPFDLLAELEAEHIRLDWAALHVARDAYPALNPARYLRKLDALADEVAELRPGLDAIGRYEALHRVLIEKHSFRGNSRHYYDPDNSYLNRVLDRKRGIPLSLSVVWIEVGRRLKWPVAGVGLPGHFLTRIDDPERFVLIDVFNGGQSLSLDDCRKLVERSTDGKVEFGPEQIEPVDNRSLLSRMLHNLRTIYLNQNDLARLSSVLRRLMALEPENGAHLQDLAAVHCRMGDVQSAYAHLAAYLQIAPDAADTDLIRGSLERLQAALLAKN